jgi:quinone-modifying oxidoreductase subunit QmoC
LLLILFGAVVLFDCLVLGVSLTRFWRALRISSGRTPTETQVAPLSASIGSVFRRIVWHQDFARCHNQAPRRVSHSLVTYSMLALVLVDIWVITARYNPLRGGLVYPLGILDPWKMLANLAGTLLIVGCLVMCRDRLRCPSDASPRPTGTYFDWQLLALLLAVAITGFITEALHFMRLDAERVWAYGLHLVTVLTFFVLLPYSKLAHVAFRTVALLFAEHYVQRRPAAQSSNQPGVTL